MSTEGAPGERNGSSPGLYDADGVWTGSELIVFGTAVVDGWRLAIVGRYNPSTDSWTAGSSEGIPRAYSRSLVWTGTEAILWGADEMPVPIELAAGRYDPEADIWRPLSLEGAPPPSCGATAVWTGSEMIVFGTYNDPDIAPPSPTSAGGAYDPERDAWRPLPLEAAPANRMGHLAVWMDGQMLVCGGGLEGDGTYFRDGGRYDPQADRWLEPPPADGAPDPPFRVTAVWTGDAAILWGGFGDGYVVNAGRGYDPAQNVWWPTSVDGAPEPRGGHTAIWTGEEMIVWGGMDGAGNYLDTGGRYRP